MVEAANPEYPEAPEPEPENTFDISSFTSGVLGELQKAEILPKDWSDALAKLTNPWAAGLAVLSKLAFPFLLKLEDGIVDFAEPQLKELVKIVMAVLGRVMPVLEDLTGVYVQQIVASGLETKPGQLSTGRGPAGDATKVVFDQILAPMLNLLTPSSPGKAGAGEANAQHILGTIISMHLSTWMINIISNLTGLGALKWINSFDDAVTAGISARGFSRMATRPYLQTYVVDPATRDLNTRWPLEIGSVSQLIKRYIRGNISRERLKEVLRGKGFDDAVVEDLLLDTAKLLSVEAVVWLVNQGKWGEEQAIESLKQQGYPEALAPAVFELERTSLVRAEYHTLASSLVNAFIDRRLDNETLRYLLREAGFTQEEVNAYATRGAILQELPKLLTRADVAALYNEGLVDLTYVRQWLDTQGYSEDDADLLELLYFCKKEERNDRKAEQANRRRVALLAALGDEEAADALRQAELLSLS